ncbi:MAG: TetR/AcrR family transcriptional regulator [Glaciecola sp.]
MASGRKREFDAETALEAAMQTFWQKGYVGTSMSDLIARMGINKPSMYRAFGNKESLFIKATQRYINTQMKPHLALLNNNELSIKTRLKNHMQSVIAMQCKPKQAYGCMLVLCQSELVSGEIPEAAKHALQTAELQPKQFYTSLFTHDEESIELGLHEHASAHAITIYTLLKGTASMARAGVSQAELVCSVDCILEGIGLH